MIRLLLAFIAGLVVLPVGALLYLWSGHAPVATNVAPLPFERQITALAMNARVSREAPRQPGAPATEENLAAGARVYRTYCDTCHGLLGGAKPPIGKGEYPPPPEMFNGQGVTDDPVEFTYWKVAHGIRLTGMPAFAGTLSDLQMWQVSQLLANGNRLPDKVREGLRAEE